jgi:hypothetical protein
VDLLRSIVADSGRRGFSVRTFDDYPSRLHRVPVLGSTTSCLRRSPMFHQRHPPALEREAG